ncbi:MAG: hypothetical protein JNM95_15310 [Chitinophagaceae bacterium]|nr:hypothetical protein [Chitinophagaceae bacterium]
MTKRIFTLALCLAVFGQVTKIQAQSDKNKKSRYYQNQTTAPEEFNVEGFFQEPERKQVEKKTDEKEYEVKIRRNEADSKYYDEKRVVKEDEGAMEKEEPAAQKRRERRNQTAYPTTYGGVRRYNENRNKYDKYYDGSAPVVTQREEEMPEPAPAPKPAKPSKTKKKQVEDREIGMTPNEHEYKTTVVKKRYTNLDVLCDDLDLAKVQRPVFKGICSECSRDVDKIITDKNLSSLEKNYNLKQCYMMRDKRLRETLDDDQYRKFLRVKDADEYLVITKDLELRDGVNK